MNTDSRLAEIQARVQAATEGPWTADSWEIHSPTGWIAESCDIDNYPKSAADGAFIANARQDIPFLLARVAELETFARGCDGEGCVLPHSSWCIRAREFAAQHSGCTCGEPWTDTPQTHAGHCWLLSPPDDEMEWHRKRVAELLTRIDELEATLAERDEQLAGLISAEPTLDDDQPGVPR